MGIFFFVITNHVFDLLIHVSINYFLLFMIFMHLLIVTPQSPPKDVRGIFLNISKAFDKVWHEELIYKMKCIGISGMLLKLLQNFLQKRHQPALLNGQCLLFYQRFLYWALCSFYNYINGLTKNISSTNKLFADDTSIFSIVMILIILNMSWIANWGKYLCGPISGRCPSIQMFKSRLNK